MNVTGSRYVMHFYCLGVEAGFYSEAVEYLPVDTAGIGKDFFGSTTNI